MSSLLLQSSFSTRRLLSGLSGRVVASSAISTPQQQQQQHQLIRTKHTVRIILKGDLPNGKAYKGDVVTVAAGYARNYLVPKKIALYATRQNFARLGLRDPDLETAEERQARLAREAIEGQDEDLKAADLLKNYLRNKVVRDIEWVVGGVWIIVFPLFLSISLFFSFLTIAQNLAQCRARYGTNSSRHGGCQGGASKTVQTIKN